MSDNPFRRPVDSINVEKLARALRGHSMRHHPTADAWEEAEDNIKEMWLQRAQWTIDYMRNDT